MYLVGNLPSKYRDFIVSIDWRYFFIKTKSILYDFEVLVEIPHYF